MTPAGSSAPAGVFVSEKCRLIETEETHVGSPYSENRHPRRRHGWLAGRRHAVARFGADG
jgi:hypothetical protein